MYKRAIALVGLVVIALACLWGCSAMSTSKPTATVSPTATAIVTPTPTEEPTPTPTPTPEPTPTKTPGIVSPLTGLPYNGNYKPIAVMIEDNPDARPQSGLQKADVVYEGLAEGGITRFMAIYNSNYPTRVGPVRSARSHFVGVQQEWDCMYVHFGGSPKALELIKSYGLKYDVDGLKGESAMKRDNSKKAPHNVFLNTTKLLDRYKTKPYVHRFNFSTEIEGTPANKVTIPFNHTFTKLVYEYDKEKNAYLRTAGGKKSIDAETGEQISVTNVLVVYSKYYNEDATHQTIELVGKGDAVLFTGGKCVKLKWEKTKRTAQTKFKDLDGNEMELQPGNTWIELLPKENKVTIK